MEGKWLAVIIVVWLASMFGGLAYSEHTKAQCRAAAIAQNMSAADIATVCK